MKIVGLITEYNPFHNGHLHHINSAKQLTGADYVVVVMSGNFLQRGTPAVIDKYNRTRMALSCGADLVIELPCVFATSSAESFAFGAVSILTKMGCIDYLCFGSEYGDITVLRSIAEILANEPAKFKEYLKSYLKCGLTFPVARKKALLDYTSNSSITNDSLEHILSEPNNILAIEYIKAIIKQNSSMEPLTIQRVVSGYHDLSIHHTICSASAIRAALKSKGLDSFKNQVPECVYEILLQEYNKTFPIFPNDFSSLLKYRLILKNSKPLTAYLDVSTSLSNTIENNISNFRNFEDFADLLKSKQYTHTRITRSLIHILLNIESKTPVEETGNESAYYIRILGFHKSSSQLLSFIHDNTSIPMLSKLADSKNYLNSDGLDMLEQDIYSSDIYNTIVTDKFGCSIPNEFRQNIIIM
ncbi:MAG: nucleotidyltransferase [Lachnotalea sp.]